MKMRKSVGACMLAAAVGMPIGTASGAGAAETGNSSAEAPRSSRLGSDPSQWKWSTVFGLRSWGTQWTTWFTEAVYNDQGANDSNVYSTSTKRMTVQNIPQLTVKYGPFGVSGSVALEETYKFDNTGDGFSGDIDDAKGKKKERDLNLGYDLFPGFTVGVGYKEIEQDFNGNKFKWSGPIASIGGSMPLRDNLGFYGVFSYGWMDANLPGTSSNLDAKYVLAEPGLSYFLKLGSQGSTILAFTVGYRVQIVETENLELAFGGVDVRDTTQGPTIGVSLRFSP